MLVDNRKLIGSYGWVGVGVFVFDSLSDVEVLNFGGDEVFNAGLWEVECVVIRCDNVFCSASGLYF